MDWQIFTTEGRITRTHYAIYVASIWAASFVVEILSNLLMSGLVGRAGLYLILSIPVWAAGYCVSVRRAHDAGYSAWFVVSLSLLQVVGLMTILVFGLGYVMGSQGALVPIMAGFGMVFASLIMTLVLALGRPDEENDWGPDPR